MLDLEIIGGKSGAIMKASQYWAVLGTKNGKEYITVVIGAELKDISNPSDSQIDNTINILSEIE